ncbi:gamma-glutamyl-gamma-aminobutyrate hydrolase family protein [Streptomyces longispororuber]|uniref:gamma-glutamyl-gamma-aminobutyrate hydrolase family protein n=1 Tax=Streptomyces longispororuber TaxID=68230 RepID=UPI00210B3235|nr:gamma-glutamyl-gamma-aminobutyrate hydrolase family protein [Streptomyces longispororuber]MCQ4213475.1 gamma-glutamyl-gamma-aminobutyrate hydrolase family protein [Streptomyces longispororuber]
MSTTEPTAPAPLIGIPVRLSDGDAPGADQRVVEANRIFDDVVDLIRAAGAEPVLLRPSFGGSPLDEQLADCRGFVVPGGGDVDPALYGADPQHPALYDVNPAQDRLDTAVIRYAQENRRPFLGICRGMQLLNIIRGGTLHLDLPKTFVAHDPEHGEGWAVHDVALSAGSAAAQVFGRDRIPVSSGHHQAVDRVGDGLRVTARADDGCVEAIELSEPSPSSESSGSPEGAESAQAGAWTLGVQWHPEAFVPSEELRLPLFRALLERVRTEAQAGVTS